MKNRLKVILSVIFIVTMMLSVSLAYTLTLQHGDKSIVMTRSPGSEVTLQIKDSYYKAWQVISGDVTITEDKFIMPEKDVVLKAVNEYTISYDANGGDGVPESQQKTHGIDLILSDIVPTKTGYTFVGWNTESDGSGLTYSAGGAFPLEGDRTLYAKWRITTYTVTYDVNGGENQPEFQLKYEGTPLVITRDIPSKEGLIFKGWGTSADATTPIYQPGGEYTEDADITLYAIYGTIAVGDHVYYPVLTENSITGTEYIMSSLFAEGQTPVFRVLQISGENVVLFPDNTEEMFKLTFTGNVDLEDSVQLIEDVCDLYTTQYSESITSVVVSQLQTASGVGDLYEICNGDYWRTGGWRLKTGSDGKTTTRAGNIIGLANDDEILYNHYIGWTFTFTKNVMPAITIKAETIFSGAGTADNPYKLSFPEEEGIAIGKYVRYPVLTENNSVTYSGTTYAMSNLFNEGEAPIFRILEVTDTNVVLFPDNTEEMFELTFTGNVDLEDSVQLIENVCDLYTTQYSESITSVVGAQLQTASNKSNLYSICNRDYWRTGGWRLKTGSDDITTTRAGIITGLNDDDKILYNHYNGWTYTYTKNVMPAITIKANVQFTTGDGTADSPYILSLPEEERISIGDYAYYPVDRTKSGIYSGTTYAMSDRFIEGETPVFRVLEVTDTSIVLFPDSTSEMFSATFSGQCDDGPVVIENICDLYTTQYSESITSIVLSQLLVASNKSNLYPICNGDYWRTDSSWTLSTEKFSTRAINQLQNTSPATWTDYEGKPTTNTSVTNYVMPAITLKANVQLTTGDGTIDSPYVLSL